MTVQEILSQFRQVQNVYADFGACDTEPDYAFQHHLASHFDLTNFKHPYPFPNSAEDWELYSDMPGAEDAAFALTSALRRVKEDLNKLMVKDPRGTRKELRDHLWRV